MSLIGLCGRTDAGKSTVASYLAQPREIIQKEYTNALAYILSAILGWDYEVLSPLNTAKEIRQYLPTSGFGSDNIWNKQPLDAFNFLLEILHIIHPFVESNLCYKFTAPVLESKDAAQTAVSVSFADVLKQICVPISGIPYDILLGETSEMREKREKPMHLYIRFLDWEKPYYLKNMSGRELLEFVGTNCFRALDPDIWINLTMRRIKAFMERCMRVVISDVRFENEAAMIKSLGGTLLILARSLKNLILTDEDRKTHPSKWQFLTFIGSYTAYSTKARMVPSKVNNNNIALINDGSLDDLKEMVLYFFQKGACPLKQGGKAPLNPRE